MFVVKNVCGFGHVCEVFGIRELNAYQREAIVQFVQKKTDVFVNLPTGYGKSLIYQALPLVYDSILEAAGHIVVVVSPLVNLMKDQVDKLANLGILAASLSEITEENAKGVVEGRFSIVYGRSAGEKCCPAKFTDRSFVQLPWTKLT